MGLAFDHRPVRRRCRSRGARRCALGGAWLLLAACAVAPPRVPDETTGPPVWPPPPETPRFRYVTTLATTADLETETAEAALREKMVGIRRQPEAVFRKPYDVAARDGRIYVTDSLARVVHVFDVPRRKIFRIGYRREGALGKPLGIDVDDAGHVYVADVGARRVIAYDAFGLYRRDIGEPGDFVRPTGVAVAPGGERVYIVDAGGVDSRAHRLLIYDRDGTRRRVVGTRGDGPGEFNLPVDAATAPDGTVYVLDAGNFRVQVFDADGNHLRSWGALGNGLGQLARPRGIAVDRHHHVYVTDGSFGNVQVFDRDGRLLLPIGSHTERARPGSYPLIAGITTDEKDHLYVVDQFHSKVEVLRYLAPE